MTVTHDYYYGIPQRWVSGMTPEESPLSRTFKNMAGREVTVDTNGVYPMLKSTGTDLYTVIPDSQLPSFARELFKKSSQFNRAVTGVVQDGKPSVKVGEGSLAGIVYRPTTEEQAKRNLNFALANLAAYVDWDEHGRKDQERIEREREENLRRVEAEKVRLEAEKARYTVRLNHGLDLYNKVNGTRAASWSSLPYTSMTTRELWAKQAEQVNQLSRRTNPYASQIFNSGGLIVDGAINAATIRARDLYPTSFRL